MDPSQPQTPAYFPLEPAPEATLESLLQEQLKLAGTLHETLATEKDTLSPREYKELVAATNSILNLAHRSEEALRIINTYKKFVETVLEFLRMRSDTLGQDLVEELKRVSRTLNTEKPVNKILDAA